MVSGVAFRCWIETVNTPSLNSRDARMKKQSSLPKWRLAMGLALLVSAGECVVLQSAPAESATKDAVLRGIVRNAMVPGYQDLSAKCGALRGAVEALVTAPTRDLLDAARNAWVAALLSARR